MRIAVLGSGSWGTALAVLWSGHGHEVALWGRNAARVSEFQNARCNLQYLPEIPFPDPLRLTDDLEAAIHDAELICLSIPLQSYRGLMKRMIPLISHGQKLLLVSKGIELETHLRPSEIVTEVLGDDWGDAAFTLAGPSFAREVAENKPTTVVLAGRHEADLALLQEALNCPFFRLYRNLDLVGVEICAGLKNVIAIASGLVKGLDLGDNALAGVITRGLAEISRLGVHMGARAETFAGLAGMGDLILTCTGKLSRNLRVGVELARGRDLQDILDELGMVAEGVHTCRSALQLSRAVGVELPIAAAVYRIINDKLPPRLALQELLSRSLKEEGRRAYDERAGR